MRITLFKADTFELNLLGYRLRGSRSLIVHNSFLEIIDIFWTQDSESFSNLTMEELDYAVLDSKLNMIWSYMTGSQ